MQKKQAENLLSTHGSCMSVDWATAHHQQAFETVQHTTSQQDMLSLSRLTTVYKSSGATAIYLRWR